MQITNVHVDYGGKELLYKYLHRLNIPTQHHAATLAKWTIYFGENSLENFQQLCEDLNVQGDLSTKTKCRKALERVHVNIAQFLRATGTPNLQVVKFPCRRDLIEYTVKKGKKKQGVFSKRDIPKGCPLRKLLKELHGAATMRNGK